MNVRLDAGISAKELRHLNPECDFKSGGLSIVIIKAASRPTMPCLFFVRNALPSFGIRKAKIKLGTRGWEFRAVPNI